MTKQIIGMLLLGFVIVSLSCTGEEFDYSSTYENNLTSIRTDLNYFRDSHNRYIYLHGINAGPDSKHPYIQGEDFTYVGKPFPLDQADYYFQLLKELGFNAIRLLMTWESIEPDGSATFDGASYDIAYLNYIAQIAEIAGNHGIYVLMDMHQDLFSRHMTINYNADSHAPFPTTEGKVDEMLAYFDLMESNAPHKISGDGAPEWAVEAVLPEKSDYVGEEDWGTFKLYLDDIRKTPDFLPITFWALNGFLSSDCNRGFAALLAGKSAFPNMMDPSGRMHIQDYLQQSYYNAWAQVVSRVHHLPNVIGYDIMNEPFAIYIMLMLNALMIELGFDIDPDNDALLPFADNPIFSIVDGLETILNDLLLDLESNPNVTLNIDNILPDADVSKLPPDIQSMPLTDKEKIAYYWGTHQTNAFGLLTMLFGFLGTYMTPFYEGAASKIVEIDKDAIIWIEPAVGIDYIFGSSGLGGQWENPLTPPPSAPQVVYCPHWYPDIYPMLGFGKNVRDYEEEVFDYRDYLQKIKEMLAPAQYSLANCPAVLGEFGTPFNFNDNNAYDDEANDYDVSKHILDNYYEALESEFISHMQWAVSIENTAEHGEMWNEEDFSILDWNQQPRAEEAYSRTYARAMSGKPVSMHYYSPLHYFDPEKGIPDMEREFYMEMQSKETEAPTEIFVPGHQYRDGFYLWVSDGYCLHTYHGDNVIFSDYYIVYWYPTKDAPGENHWIKIRPPYPDYENTGWDYYIQENTVLQR